MKRALIKTAVFLLILCLLGGLVWFFTTVGSGVTAGVLENWGQHALTREKYESAVRWYGYANRLEPEDDDIAIALSQAYEGLGNYTKAEFTLANAIAAGADEALYMRLCQVYVKQDKLLDAVSMLDHISDPAIKAKLDAQRPTIPVSNLDPGFYNQYMNVEITSNTGKLYVGANDQYPTIEQPYTGGIALSQGETTIRAVAVADNGLVSPLAIFGYTVDSVVEDVTLWDSALDTYVRELLGVNAEAQLTTSDLWGITEMTVPTDVLDLRELRYFTRLQSLVLRDQTVSDLSFLESLTNLETLTISDSILSAEDVEWIGTQSQLKNLTLVRCSLSTLSGLEALTNLQTVDLSSNSISDLKPLANNADIRSLNVSGNAIASVDGLQGLSAMEELHLDGNMLTSIAGLNSMKNLRVLTVSENSLPSLRGVDALTALVELNASGNALTDAEGVGSCVNLETLDLSNNKMTVMDGLEKLTKVTHMDVSYNDIVTVPSFPVEAALVEFNGCHNFFEDVSGLADLENLEYVRLDYNNVYNINVLSGCPSLKQVDVFRTNVTDISQLEGRGIVVSYAPKEP